MMYWVELDKVSRLHDMNDIWKYYPKPSPSSKIVFTLVLTRKMHCFVQRSSLQIPTWRFLFGAQKNLRVERQVGQNRQVDQNRQVEPTWQSTWSSNWRSTWRFLFGEPTGHFLLVKLQINDGCTLHIFRPHFLSFFCKGCQSELRSTFWACAGAQTWMHRLCRESGSWAPRCCRRPMRPRGRRAPPRMAARASPWRASRPPSRRCSRTGRGGRSVEFNATSI